MFLQWADVSFHVYGGRSEYAHVVSIDRHMHTEVCLASPPPLGYQ